MTTEASRGAFLYIHYYSSYWRGLTALSILCGEAMREPVEPGWAEKQTPTPFLYHKLTFGKSINGRVWGVWEAKNLYKYGAVRIKTMY